MPTPTKSHAYWMDKALELAQDAARAGEVPVGCVIVKDDHVVASSRNEVEARSDVRAHAEMLAIERASEALSNKYLAGCTLYVTLEPCPMCAGALVWTKIDRVVFGAMDPKAGACGTLFNVISSPQLNHRVELVHGVREQESEKLLKEFFRDKRGT